MIKFAFNVADASLDSTPTLSIVRTDTGATVVSAGTLMTDDGNGDYHYDFDADIAGVSYQATFVAMFNSRPITWSSSVKTSPPASGYYASQSDLEDEFGTTNVQNYSDLSGAGAVDEGRIARALAFADERINHRLRVNNIQVPVATSSQDFLLLTRIAAQIAGCWLYESRGVRDDNTDNKMSAVADEATARLNELCLPGRLDASTAASMANAPSVV